MTGNTLGMQVLEALGIKANYVRAVQINMSCNEAATVQVTTLVEDDQGRRIVERLSSYRVELIDQEPS